MFDWMDICWFDKENNPQPSVIDRAFCFANIGGWYQDQKRDFLTRWGGLDLETFVQVLSKGECEDRIVSIWVLALSNHPQARILLQPFLQSFVLKERWSSVLCLGEMGEEQTVTQLCSLLTEYLPAQENEHPQGDEEQWWFDERRNMLPRILRKWNNPFVNDALNNALERIVQTEQYASYDIQSWYIFEDMLAYELGFRGDLRLLASNSLPPHRSHIAVINMAIGVYDAMRTPDTRYGYGLFDGYVGFTRDQPLISALADILIHRFGFSEQKALAYLKKHPERVPQSPLQIWVVRER